jgi:hypothetical protein
MREAIQQPNGKFLIVKDLMAAKGGWPLAEKHQWWLWGADAFFQPQPEGSNAFKN